MAATTAVNLTEVAAEWRAARRIYPIYAALVRQHQLGSGCSELDSPIDRSDSASLQRVSEWFEKVDDLVEAWQLRQLLQTTHLATEENLKVLVRRHLQKPTKTPKLRDKVDYLLVQCYAHCAPQETPSPDLEFSQVAQVLAPVLNQPSPSPPACEPLLEDLLAELAKCHSLADMLRKHIVERAREVKDRAGDEYYSPAMLVAFARFNFLMRHGFFRLMHADLHATRIALQALEARGQEFCDCSAAGLSRHESLARLGEISRDWKRPFRAAYSPASNFKQLVAIRIAVEAAVKLPPPVVTPIEGPPIDLTAAEMPVPGEATPLSAAGVLNLESCMQGITEQLPKRKISATVSNIMLGGTKLLLASWEVAAFAHSDNEFSAALRRAVAACAWLQILMEQKGSEDTGALIASIHAAQTEAAQMQEQIAQAKDAKNIDAAVNLSATQKRLLAKIAEAENSAGVAS